MDGRMDVSALVLLLTGAGATYVAFLHPAFGVALLVGIAVVSVLCLLLQRR
ncbi:hypothetical protein ABT160_28800 [Streptomyces sp. NPDC001941]|uniref:hypothetical protein n=1 Tax=Streptomyces sp. NPDC001941 TaxID=3154659 RepID=UPI00332B5979